MRWHPIGKRSCALIAATSERPDVARGAGQRVFAVLALLLVIALVTRAFGAVLGRLWALPVAVFLLGSVIAGLAVPPGLIVYQIPTIPVATTSKPLLTLSASPKFVADLILLSTSPQAVKQPPDDPTRHSSLVQPNHFKIGGETQSVLAAVSTSTITYIFDLPAHAQFKTALALNPAIWHPDKGDGVEFVVRLQAGAQGHELLRRYIDPKHSAADHTWHTVSIDLSAYGGQQVQLALTTLPGPKGDSSYNWAGWAQPKIVLAP